MPDNSSLVHYVDSTFHYADYIVFCSFLCLSGAVGIFFSFRGQKNTREYFLGGRTMRPIPVGISTGVSFMSAASLVGLPSEVYINGYSYILSLFSASFGFFAGCSAIACILHPLSMTSLSEYLHHKYHSKVITYSSNIVVLFCILQYMGICMLGSVIAFNSATGGQVSIPVALTIGGVVGTFYTTFGGIKAVVWSDVIQFGFMLIGIVAVIISSISNTPGGMSEIIRLGLKYKRIHVPVWTFDITIRHTFWGLSMGILVYWLVWCVQPACVQRLCSTRTKGDAIIVSGIAASIFFSLSLLPSLAGLNIFGYYASRGCDVFANGWIKNNEIILYYVRERLNYPGFQGLFIAALYAGSLSSLSSGLNAGSSLLWKDTVQPLLKIEVSDAKATLISKLIVLVFGVISMAWCYTLYSIGGLIIQMGSTIDASMYGAYFGVFALAVLCYHATWKGAVAGMITSFAFTLWIGIGNLLSGKASGNRLPTVTGRCALNGSETLGNVSSTTYSPEQTCHSSLISTLYSISYEWLSLICILISLTVSLIVVALTGPAPHSTIDPRLILRCCRPGMYGRRSDETSEDDTPGIDEREAFVDGRIIPKEFPRG